jgi:pyruvate carboxylase
MRVVRDPHSLEDALAAARSEARAAFGKDTIFMEKYVEIPNSKNIRSRQRFLSHPKHIEVQLLGDRHGNIVHLFERDCSLQRKHQKIIEIAPAPKLSSEIRDQIFDAALKLGRLVKYGRRPM